MATERSDACAWSAEEGSDPATSRHCTTDECEWWVGALQAGDDLVDLFDAAVHPYAYCPHPAACNEEDHCIHPKPEVASGQ